MLRWMIPLVGLLVFACPISASAGMDPWLIDALRTGGNVLVMRHGATRADQKDTNPHDPSDWAHQRQLSEEGRATARTMGAALHALAVPVDQVRTSEFLRTIETGTLLGFGDVTPDEALTEGHMGMEARPGKGNGQALRRLAAMSPPSGTNIILVTHKPNIVDALGKPWSDVAEGETIVLLPDDMGGFFVLARITASEWESVAKAH